MRKCRRCAEYLDAGMFRIRPETGNSRQICRECETKSNVARYHGNPSTKSSHRKASYRYNLKKYGLTESDFDALRAAQSYECAICEIHETETRLGTLSVDHDRHTGTVRGLLCHNCNVALGHLQEQPVQFLRALDYLIERTPRWQPLLGISGT
jgi:hypothetical protein